MRLFLGPPLASESKDFGYYERFHFLKYLTTDILCPSRLPKLKSFVLRFGHDIGADTTHVYLSRMMTSCLM